MPTINSNQRRKRNWENSFHFKFYVKCVLLKKAENLFLSVKLSHYDLKIIPQDTRPRKSLTERHLTLYETPTLFTDRRTGTTYICNLTVSCTFLNPLEIDEFIKESHFLFTLIYDNVCRYNSEAKQERERRSKTLYRRPKMFMCNVQSIWIKRFKKLNKSLR